MINYKGMGWINQEGVGDGLDTKLIKCAVGYFLVEIFGLTGRPTAKKRRPHFEIQGAAYSFLSQVTVN